MSKALFKSETSSSRPARGEWIEIRSASCVSGPASSLAPHGASGLKFDNQKLVQTKEQSRPARGEWIEIIHVARPEDTQVSLAPHGASGLK